MASPSSFIPQAAVIPVLSGRVCLVMSRDGKRWVFPKGHVDPGRTPAEAALQEAWEEAGLVGVLSRSAVGSYLYEKRGATYHVLVYRLDVTTVADHWPEPQRGRRWLSPDRALAYLSNPGLRRLVAEVFAAAPAETPA